MVEKAFADQNHSGAVGTQALGKGIWYRADAIKGTCLTSKHWGHIDDPRTSSAADKASVRRISPSYSAQRFWTASTEEGYCIYLGDDLSMKVTEVNKMGDAYVAEVTYSVARPDGWWDCVEDDVKNTFVRVVETDDGALSIESEVGIFGGACPNPLPLGNIDRKGDTRPKAKPKKAPTGDDAIAAAKAFDDALFAGDLTAALDALSCYNLYEKTKYGTCAPSELLNLGPIPRGNPRMQDGPPWTMNAFKSLEDIGRPVADAKDPTLFHAQVKAAKGKYKARNISIQWVDNTWKLVGVIGKQAEGLTTVVAVYDLDRKAKREIFEKRMAGEEINEDGTPSDGMVRMGYQTAEEAKQ